MLGWLLFLVESENPTLLLLDWLTLLPFVLYCVLGIFVVGCCDNSAAQKLRELGSSSRWRVRLFLRGGSLPYLGIALSQRLLLVAILQIIFICKWIEITGVNLFVLVVLITRRYWAQLISGLASGKSWSLLLEMLLLSKAEDDWWIENVKDHCGAIGGLEPREVWVV